MKNYILYLLAFILSSCNTAVDSGDRAIISVSIIPQKYFVEELAGRLAEINVLIPPGASPATYEPTVSQLQKLEHSVVYMRIGYVGFEQSWMDKIKAVNPKLKIVDLSEGISLIEEENRLEESHQGHVHPGPDPHIWMSTHNARIIARNIHKELMLLFPSEQKYLQERFDHFSASLDSVNHEIMRTLEGMENRKFMIYHPALTYYARVYGLEQYSLEIEGKTPSPAHLMEMTDLARTHHINKILIQSQFDRKNAEVLARETGAE
ncbi:MAG: zinc ABC transporter substrate-binding protein, partial [bacterium]